mmetsp:Transcript_7154/g.13225  ORF Transcript_7154/g.13225 Transcript_7154/m.13225 type:complete len:237 (+) Transcript_7154:843-1553(+)
MTGSVVQDDSIDKSRFVGGSRHGHDFDSVQIDGLVGSGVNALDGTDNRFAKHAAGVVVEFGGEGSTGDAGQQITVLDHTFAVGFVVKGCLNFVEILEGLFSGLFQSLYEDPWMDSLGNVSVRLSKQFSAQEHGGGGPIARDVVLSGGSPGNQNGRGMLDLHFLEEDHSVFGEFELPRSSHEELEGSTRAQIGLEDVQEADTGGHIDGAGLCFGDNLGIWIDITQLRHVADVFKRIL